LKILDLEMH